MQETKRVKDPRKQRKFLHTAPAHLRHRLMAAPLSKELAKSKGAKTLPVRKGDTIRIMRGDHVGFEGKVSRIDLKRYRIFVEGLTREKVDGTNIFVAVHPSKVLIRSLNLDDKWRKAIVERKHELELTRKEEKVTPKPAKKTIKVKAEKPVGDTEELHVEEEKLQEKKPIVKPKAAKQKSATNKEELIAVKEKAPVRKQKEKASVAKEKSAEKGKKPKVTAKEKPAKRKTADSKKEGGE
jgi:large subunit ribosomal protein L24